MGEWVPNPPQDGVSGSSYYRLVTDRFQLTQDFAADAFADTKKYIDTLQTTIQELSPPPTGDIDDIARPYVPEMSYTARPSFGKLGIEYNWPTSSPALGPMLNVPDIPAFELPLFNVQSPAWQNPERPSHAVLQEPGDAPVVVIPSIPTAPPVVLPPAPVLTPVVLPPPPDIVIPDFDGVLPNDVINVPGGFSWEASPYNSPIWINLLDKVSDGLRDGGTGLSADVEQEIMERARYRQRLANEKAYRDTENLFLSKGHRVPPGALASQLQQTANAILAADAEINGQVMIKQAELAQTNTHFILDKSVELEKILRDFHDSQESRTIEGAKALADSSVAIYNAIVAKINLGLEAYKASASAYEQRVRAAVSKVEMFKAQVESAAVSASVQETLINLYGKQVAAVETYIKIYQSQMEGVRLQVDVQRQVLDVYKDQVGLYAAKLEARRVLQETYKSELEAEKSKAEVYTEQVRAFAITVDARKAESTARIEHARSITEANRVTSERYQAELAGYIAEIDGESKRTSAIVEGFRGEVAAYAAETGALEMMYGAKVKEIDARISESRFMLEKAVAQISSATEGYVAIKSLEIKGAEGIMNVGAQLTAASMGAVSASASVGTSIGKTESHGYSHSEQISESHSYQHE